jgi:hypothetical protein
MTQSLQSCNLSVIFTLAAGKPGALAIQRFTWSPGPLWLQLKNAPKEATVRVVMP